LKQVRRPADNIQTRGFRDQKPKNLVFSSETSNYKFKLKLEVQND